MGKSLHSPMIEENSKSVSIMKCVALHKSGQMCKLKEKILRLDSDLSKLVVPFP